MPYVKAFAYSFDDLINKIINFATSEALHGEDAWEVVRHEPWPRGTILKAHGWQPGEKMYVGLMPARMEKDKTYKEWFLDPEVLKKEFIFNRRGLNLPQDSIISISGSDVYVYSYSYEWKEHKNSKDEVLYRDANIINLSPSQRYSFRITPEIFNRSSQALFLGVFKQYSDGLLFHEQAGAPTPPVKPKPIKYNVAGADFPTNWTPPAYPGVGFPALGSNIQGFKDGVVWFWLVKDRHRLIIALQDRDRWQVAQLGFLVPHHTPTEYAFPAVVVGGTSGVIPVKETFYYGNSRVVEDGYQFDYSVDNQFLSYGNPTFATSWWDGRVWRNNDALSQVQLMLPDGQWQSFSNWAINKQVIVGGTNDSPVYYFTNKEPEQPAGMNYQIYPTRLDLTKTRNILQPNPDKYQYQLEPLELIQMDAGAEPKIGMLGSLWNTYWPSSKIVRYGEQVLNGKLHLVIPNGWEGRRFHLPHGMTGIIDPDELLNEYNRIEAISKTMNCVIRLED